MTRIDFVKKFMRFLLFAVLTLIVFALGRKVVIAADCQACPGKGICNGKQDCSKY